MKKADFNFDQYHQNIWSDTCLFCRLADHIVAEEEHYLYEDDFAIAVLDRYPTQHGYSLVAPKEHLEKIHELDTETYLRLQRIVHLIVRAVQLAFNAERVYTACLGSQQLTPHIHYHIAPISGDLPFERQQWEALNKRAGVIEYSKEASTKLAERIRDAIHEIRMQKSHF